MNQFRCIWHTLTMIRGLLSTAVLVLALAGPVAAETARPEMAKAVGDQAPIFAAATSQDTLADYNRDYYGRHHLVLTFFPAAFTPI